MRYIANILKTVSIPMTFTGDKKVMYFKVSVKATK